VSKPDSDTKLPHLQSFRLPPSNHHAGDHACAYKKVKANPRWSISHERNLCTATGNQPDTEGSSNPDLNKGNGLSIIAQKDYMLRLYPHRPTPVKPTHTKFLGFLCMLRHLTFRQKCVKALAGAHLGNQAYLIARSHSNPDPAIWEIAHYAPRRLYGSLTLPIWDLGNRALGEQLGIGNSGTGKHPAYAPITLTMTLTRSNFDPCR
jgi:hypothetical protein